MLFMKFSVKLKNTQFYQLFVQSPHLEKLFIRYVWTRIIIRYSYIVQGEMTTKNDKKIIPTEEIAI